VIIIYIFNEGKDACARNKGIRIESRLADGRESTNLAGRLNTIVASAVRTL